jgi:hypothetical protein
MIPRVIHQIWIGPKPVPKWTKTWERIPGWSYRLWREHDFLPLTNLQKQYDDYTGIYAVQSDLVRLELLLKYGGFYLDCDCVNLRPLPLDLFDKEDTFAASYEGHYTDLTRLANGIMAAARDSITIKFLIGKLLLMPVFDKKYAEWGFVSGPSWMTKQLRDHPELPCRCLPSRLFLPSYRPILEPKPENYPDSYCYHLWGSKNPKLRKYNI